MFRPRERSIPYAYTRRLGLIKLHGLFGGANGTVDASRSFPPLLGDSPASKWDEDISVTAPDLTTQITRVVTARHSLNGQRVG